LSRESEANVLEDKPANRTKAKKSTVQKQGKTHEKATKPTFPAKGMVNAYGFIHLSNGVAEDFGAPKGQKTPITIDLKDGSLIISKA